MRIQTAAEIVLRLNEFNVQIAILLLSVIGRFAILNPDAASNTLKVQLTHYSKIYLIHLIVLFCCKCREMCSFFFVYFTWLYTIKAA